MSDAEPMLPSFGTTIAPEPPFSVRTPTELNDIVSAAAAEAAVLKDNLVALLLELKSPSDTASIPAATSIASVPVPSSGA